MSDELKKLQAKFATLKKEANVVYSEDANLANTSAKASALNAVSIEGLGVRVRELRAKGTTGDDINDFLHDKETMKIYENVVSVVASLKKTQDDKAANVEAAKNVLAKFDALKATLAKEIKARSKKIVGKKSESSPEMQTLIDEIDTFCSADPGTRCDSLNALAQLTIKPFSDTTLQNRIAAELKKSAGQAASDDRSKHREMLEQSLNVRLLKGKFNKMATLYKQVTSDSEECAKALKAKDSAGAKKELAKVLKALDEMEAIMTPLNEAYEDNKGYLKTSESGAEAIEFLGNMTTLQNKAAKTVATLQKAVK
ncbi:MAG: hypothetical protein SGJ19_15525 [Planctomycetia bacterium]|nr:hypothetical protein [Planctomycetia bacterium]